MPGNPFHIRICAQDVANVHYVFNDKSPWEAKHCSMSFIASQFDQGIPKFALPRGNIQNCKAHLPLKRLNHHKSFQNHSKSHQSPAYRIISSHVSTHLVCHSSHSTGRIFRNWGIGPHNDIPQRHTRRGHSHCLPESLAMAEAVRLLGCLVYLYTMQETNQRTRLFSWFIIYFLYNAIHNSIIKRTWPFI